MTKPRTVEWAQPSRQAEMEEAAAGAGPVTADVKVIGTALVGSRRHPRTPYFATSAEVSAQPPCASHSCRSLSATGVNASDVIEGNGWNFSMRGTMPASQR
jgi:hypothetical protein